MSHLYVCARNLLCAASLFSFAASSFAATIVLGPSIPLSDLLAPSAFIEVGDKKFTDFTYAFTGNVPSATGVNVIPIQDMAGNWGIRFQGGFLDLPGGNSSDALITFNVTATDLTMLISDVHLAANVAVAGTGVSAVVETFLPSFPNSSLLVLATPGSTILTDSIIFDTPVRTLPVQKDIILFAEGAGSAALLSFVDQTFSQVPDPNQNEIAEPATISMVGLLGMFLGAIHMRRRLG